MNIMKKYVSEDEQALCYFYEQMNADCNKNHSRVVWEFLRNAPCFPMFQLDKVGMWFENNEVVALVRLQSPWPGCVSIDHRSASIELLHDVIQYAEDTYYGMETDKKFIIICVGEKQQCLKRELEKKNYEQLPSDGGTLHYPLNNVKLQVYLPDGFEVKTLSEVYNFDRLSKLIWEGFNYDGPVPKFDDEVYPTIKHAWLNYNRDICSVVIAPDGSYASFCGFWYDGNTQTGYLEPMVTAKEYRNLGLGKAGVYHSLNILKTYGCKTVFVDPDEEPYHYYRRIGFEEQSYYNVFKKYL